MNELLENYGIENILHMLGISNIKETSDYYSFSSPWRTDKNPSMVLYKRNLYCVDFGGSFKGSLFKLIKIMSGRSAYSFLDIKDIHSNVFERSLQKSNRLKERKFHFPEKREIKIEGTVQWRNQILSNDSVLSYMKRRKISIDFVQNFNLGYAFSCSINDTKMWNRLLIPIMNEEGTSMQSVEARDTTGKSSKKVLYPKGGSVSILFNYHALNKKEPLIVVEGIMDIPQIWEHISKNVTTTFGIQITKHQEKLLKEFDDIILFPDGDEGGKTFISNLDKFYPKEFCIAWTENKDPGDCSVEELKEAIKRAKRSVDYFLDKSNLFDSEKVEWIFT